MLGWRGWALGMASSLIFVAAGEAQQAKSPRVATAEPLPAVAPAVAPAPAPQDPLGIALQQKLTAPVKARADEGQSQDRAALVGFYAARVYAPIWVTTSGFNAKATAAIAEFGKADDWGLSAADFAPPAIVAAAGDGPTRSPMPNWSCRSRRLSTLAMRAAAASPIRRRSCRRISTASRSCSSPRP
jgi:hypothetical protein